PRAAASSAARSWASLDWAMAVPGSASSARTAEKSTRFMGKSGWGTRRRDYSEAMVKPSPTLAQAVRGGAALPLRPLDPAAPDADPAAHLPRPWRPGRRACRSARHWWWAGAGGIAGVAA